MFYLNLQSESGTYIREQRIDHSKIGQRALFLTLTAPSGKHSLFRELTESQTMVSFKHKGTVFNLSFVTYDDSDLLDFVSGSDTWTTLGF